MIAKRRIKIKWTCSDFAHHEHRWRFTAWICGRVQLIFSKVRS